MRDLASAGSMLLVGLLVANLSWLLSLVVGRFGRLLLGVDRLGSSDSLCDEHAAVVSGAGEVVVLENPSCATVGIIVVNKNMYRGFMRNMVRLKAFDSLLGRHELIPEAYAVVGEAYERMSPVVLEARLRRSATA